MSEVLIVIDIQKGTTSSRYHGQYLNRKWWSRFISVLSNIRYLCSRFSDVIFITHSGFRKPEYKDIVNELQEQASTALRLHRNEDDGSAMLAPHLRKTDTIYLCGMNTDACVFRTARGLHRMGFSVIVVADACWSVYASKSPKPHNNALYRLRSRYDIRTQRISCF